MKEMLLRIYQKTYKRLLLSTKYQGCTLIKYNTNMLKRSIQGVDVSDCQTVRLERDMLKGIDLEKYPPHRVHFLVYALQMQTKVPSQSSMIKTENKNQMKNGKDKANAATERDLPRRDMPRRDLPRRGLGIPQPVKKAKRAFRVPNRYGPQPIVYPRRRIGGRGRGARRGGYRGDRDDRRDRRDRRDSRPMRGIGGMMQQQGRIPPMNMPPPMGFPPNMPIFNQPNVPPSNMPPSMVPPSPNMPQIPQSLWIPPLPVVPAGFALGNLVGPKVVNVSPEPKGQIKHPDVIKKQEEQKQRKQKNLPQELVRKQVQKKPKKEVKDIQNIRSPEWIALKSQRTAFIEEVQKVRKENKKDKLPELVNNLEKEVPQYFRKKKENQKRRRQEKHQLIKKNRKELVKIFGNAIFQSGWPISRKQIKQALGIHEDRQKVEELGSFMQEAEKMAEEKPIENEQKKEKGKEDPQVGEN